ncbi:hypothetical protein AYI70_g10458 [Smittium culicis]|uniref:Uncharacterized protein n=1 Tax=Smittium culicis TaxID=133412 RepID=A0A1R1X6I8_9FUNG|nr:hypothetical protein AYI70_g10458 [Smittium culicis]
MSERERIACLVLRQPSFVFKMKLNEFQVYIVMVFADEDFIISSYSSCHCWNQSAPGTVWKVLSREMIIAFYSKFIFRVSIPYNNFKIP